MDNEMIRYTELLEVAHSVFFVFPGIKPKAVKRNVLIVLFYLLLLGIGLSLYTYNTYFWL